jgi:fatty-acyl-CoA synthase
MPSILFDRGLGRTAANHVALSPLSFLPKAAQAFPDRPAIAYGDRITRWADMYRRCRQLAAALAGLGIGRGDTVAVMSPNTPPMCELHFAVPMLGAVLLTMNIRLDAAAIAFQLGHGEASVVFIDREFSAVMAAALAMLPETHRPVVIDIDDPAARGGQSIGAIEYEAFLGAGDPDFAWSLPHDEWDAIALNYTSGTTGDPKGVVTSHRGAALNAINNVFTATVQPHAAYLWTVPMFHCNGWCFGWTMALVAGVNVCLRRVEAAAIFDAIRQHGVTQMSGAPIVYAMLIDAARAFRVGMTQRITGTTGGSAPPSSTFSGAAAIGIDLVHIYGLTETYGPSSFCPVREEWAALAPAEFAAKVARQGLASRLQQDMRVLDPATMAEVPHDGETIGEIMYRGNIVMKGYLKNEAATQASFAGGWLHTGDLAVVEPDGFVRITDRSKDVIISGGENISSIEVEDVLHRHPAVQAAAVIGVTDPKWGETPWAFIERRPEMPVTAEELAAFSRAHLAGYKIPKRFVFAAIPRTATGKTQKYVLREQARRIKEESTSF